MTAVSHRPAPLTRPAVATPPRPRVIGKVALRSVSIEALGSLAGSAVASLSLVWVLYSRVLPFHGALGFWLCTYAACLVLFGAVSGLQFGRRVVVDRVMTVLAATGGIVVIVVLVDLFGYTLVEGSRALRHLNFFTHTMSLAGPLSPLTKGGAFGAAVGSLEQLGIATAISVPLGLLAALYMAEIGGRLAYVVRIVVDAMTALPSIVAGLFVLSLYIVTLHFPQSGFAAALAISVMMLPIITRAAEVIIRLVPNSLREAAYAMGSSQWRVAWNVVLPTARSGLTTAVVLGMARGIGETSPVLLTAGFTQELNVNPLSGQQVSLPLYIYNYVRFPEQTEIDRAFGAGVLLMLIVLVLFVTARILGGAAPGEVTKRQHRKMARATAAARARAVAERAENGQLQPAATRGDGS